MRLIFVFLIPITLFTCKNHEVETSKTAGSEFISLEDPVNQYQVENHEYIFGDSNNLPLALVAGLSVTNNGQVYIFDHTLKGFYELNSKGDVLEFKKLPEGRGPGEYSDPLGFAASDERVYIYDQNLFRLTASDGMLETVNIFQDETSTLNMVIQPLGEGKILAARNLFRIKPDEFTCFIYDSNENEILLEFDQSYDTIVKTKRERVQLNDMAMPVYANGKYYVLLSLPFQLKEYDLQGRLLNTYQVKNRENPYFERDGFVNPTYANIGFTWDDYYELFLVTILNNRNRSSKLYLFDKNFELNSVIDLSRFKVHEDDLFQNLTNSSDHKGNVYLLSNSREGPKILKIQLSES